MPLQARQGQVMASGLISSFVSSLMSLPSSLGLSHRVPLAYHLPVVSAGWRDDRACFFGDQGGKKKTAHIIGAGGNHNETEQSSRKLSAHRPTGPSVAVELGSGCSGRPLLQLVIQK